ncbi:MAG: AbrB/MazE/SpoVT family DNA-binding domain-containing protein [Thaumarchaeota archaeon]|nr:AbrB/MazE/SpoVT family DNA-binding domain-containing protein [Nitrososphaerota archaeon]
MRQYQVTRKLQVTIPKKLAEKTGIKPGDSVVFEEEGGAITLRRAGRGGADRRSLISAIEGLAGDMEKVGPKVKEAERGLVEGLSRHVSPQ